MGKITFSELNVSGNVIATPESETLTEEKVSQEPSPEPSKPKKKKKKKSKKEKRHQQERDRSNAARRAKAWQTQDIPGPNKPARKIKSGTNAGTPMIPLRLFVKQLPEAKVDLVATQDQLNEEQIQAIESDTNERPAPQNNMPDVSHVTEPPAANISSNDIIEDEKTETEKTVNYQLRKFQRYVKNQYRNLEKLTEDFKRYRFKRMKAFGLEGNAKDYDGPICKFYHMAECLLGVAKERSEEIPYLSNVAVKKQKAAIFAVIFQARLFATVTVLEKNTGDSKLRGHCIQIMAYYDCWKIHATDSSLHDREQMLQKRGHD